MATGQRPDPIRFPRSSHHLLNLLATVATQVLDAVVPTVIVLMIANCYGLESLGTYCVASAFASVAALLCGTGISNAVCFDVAAAGDDLESQNAVLTAGTIAFTLCSAVALPLVVGASWAMGYGPSTVGMVAFLTVGSGLRALAGLFNAVLRGRREMQVAVVPMLLSLLLTAAAVMPLLAAGSPLAHVAAIWAACQACPPIWLFVALRRRGLFTAVRGVGLHLARVARASWMMTLESVLFRVGLQAVVVMLPWLLTAREIGLYNAAAKPFQIIVLANECVIQFFLPYLAVVPRGARREFESRLQQFHKAAFFFTATTLVLVAVFAPSIATILFGDVGAAVAPFMATLACGYIVYYLPPYSGGFKSIGQSRLSVACATAQLITILVALPLLVPRFGVWGIIWAVCLAFTVYWLMEVWLYRMSGLKPVAGIERYLAFIAFNVAVGVLLQARLGGLAGMVVFLCTTALASLPIYWTRDERRLAVALAFHKAA